MLTVKEYSARIDPFLVARAAEMLMQPNPLLHAFLADLPPRKPPTLRERLSAFVSRARDAWSVLTGKYEVGEP